LSRFKWTARAVGIIGRQRHHGIVARPSIPGAQPAAVIDRAQPIATNPKRKMGVPTILNNDGLSADDGENIGIPGFGIDSIETNSQSSAEKLRRTRCKAMFTLSFPVILLAVLRAGGPERPGRGHNSYRLLSQAIPESDRFFGDAFSGCSELGPLGTGLRREIHVVAFLPRKTGAGGAAGR